MFRARRVYLQGDVLSHDKTEKFVLEVPRQSPREQVSSMEEEEEQQSSQSEPGKYAYLQKIPQGMRQKAIQVLSFIEYSVDAKVLKCHPNGQVSAFGTILPGAQLEHILPSLLSKSSLVFGEAYFITLLQEHQPLQSLLHRSKRAAKQSGTAENLYRDYGNEEDDLPGQDPGPRLPARLQIIHERSKMYPPEHQDPALPTSFPEACPTNVVADPQSFWQGLPAKRMKKVIPTNKTKKGKLPWYALS